MITLAFPIGQKTAVGLATTKYYFDMCTCPIQLKVTSLYQPSDSPVQLKQNTQKGK